MRLFVIPMLLVLSLLFVAGCQRGDAPLDQPVEQPVGQTPAVSEPVEGPASAEQIGRVAIQALQQERQIPAAEVRVVSVEAVTWGDACLGAARPDELCAEVLTPGFRVVLEARGQRYTYHTDETGEYLRLAPAP